MRASCVAVNVYGSNGRNDGCNAGLGACEVASVDIHDAPWLVRCTLSSQDI